MASPREQQTTSAIELRSVTMSFGEHTVLRDINLQIPFGERLVLVGPSGQGKSVLLKLMAGLIAPTKGEVIVEGHNIHRLSEADRHQLVRKMGMLFQKNALFDSMTAGQNVAFPLFEMSELSAEEIDQKVDWFLQRVAIPHAKGLFPDEISGGMQKRLGIARALVLDPEIIFYDDPTAGLDPITSRLIVDLILELQKEKQSTLVAITNDMNRAYQMADRMAVIVDQEVIVTGSVEQTKVHDDPRVHQFIRGLLQGPLTEAVS